MKLSVIACDVLLREISALAARSPHMVDLQFLPKGLHDLRCQEMLARLQEAVDACAECDAVVMAYALCGNGLAGLRAHRVPLVIPKAHDCITLLMGSRARYRAYFDANPGIYFRSPGWIERGSGSSQLSGFDTDKKALVAKYGEENAAWLYEQMHSYEKTYRGFTHIRTGVTGEDLERRFEETTKADAQRLGWTFESLTGDLTLLERLLAGDWDGEDFVVAQPGELLAATWDDQVLEARLAP